MVACIDCGRVATMSKGGLLLCDQCDGRRCCQQGEHIPAYQQELGAWGFVGIYDGQGRPIENTVVCARCRCIYWHIGMPYPRAAALRAEDADRERAREDRERLVVGRDIDAARARAKGA